MSPDQGRRSMAISPSEGCAFCRIIGGETSDGVVFDDACSLAFLDHHPLLRGHCLLVPKQHVETFHDLPAPLIEPLFTNAQLLARAVERGLQADGSFVAINTRTGPGGISIPPLMAKRAGPLAILLRSCVRRRHYAPAP